MVELGLIYKSHERPPSASLGYLAVGVLPPPRNVHPGQSQRSLGRATDCRVVFSLVIDLGLPGSPL